LPKIEIAIQHLFLKQKTEKTSEIFLRLALNKNQSIKKPAKLVKKDFKQNQLKRKEADNKTNLKESANDLTAIGHSVITTNE
jgi:hypothetical protein